MSMTPLQRCAAIAAKLAADPSFPRMKLAAMLGVSQGAVSQDLRAMKGAGQIGPDLRQKAQQRRADLLAIVAANAAAGSPMPAHNTVADALKVHPETVGLYLSELRETGEIEVVRRAGPLRWYRVTEHGP